MAAALTVAGRGRAGGGEGGMDGGVGAMQPLSFFREGADAADQYDGPRTASTWAPARARTTTRARRAVTSAAHWLARRMAALRRIPRGSVLGMTAEGVMT